VPLASGLSYLDLHFLGRPRAIATAVVASSAGVALVDPGPTSCLGALEEGLNGQGIRLGDVTHLLLTHIHLDHAGATGTIARRHPDVKVCVHERGAKHLIEPQKLLDSARRLYGDDMDRLWGEFAAVPSRNVQPLAGGERLSAAGRLFEVAYTPGHASHHVSYFDASSGVAFVGDTAGISVDGGYIVPPTPPPDIDLEAWGASVARIESWRPATLFLTHFGPGRLPPSTHLRTLLDHLELNGRLVRETLASDGSDADRRRHFATQVAAEMRRTMTDEQMAAYGAAAPFEMLWDGLARYWRTRA
jgi:glyoxylase-like metal-dependent hydrolase (beta-lactamase superfamily II)